MAAGGDAEKAGKAAWESGWRFPQEDAEPEHRLVFGGELTFAELLAEPARPDEDWDDEEPLALRPSRAPPLGGAADVGAGDAPVTGGRARSTSAGRSRAA